MPTDSGQVPPLACVPSAIPPEARSAHLALTERLFGSEVLEKVTIPNGYEFRFDHAAFEDVARFVALERVCCPFLDFAIELQNVDGPVRLRLTGPRGVREFLDAELA